MNKIFITVLVYIIAIPIVLGATVSIDGSIEHQTIEGFGGDEGWLLPPQSLYPAIFDDLGIRILRFRLFPNIEQAQYPNESDLTGNDNNDPFITNWSHVNTGFLGFIAPLLQETKNHNGKLIATLFEPPGWMRIGAIETSGGTIRGGYEDELVEFIIIGL
jgi:hypothetical protein